MVGPPQPIAQPPAQVVSTLLPPVRQPVAWVVEQGIAVQRSDARPIHDFELPTDINQPIDDSVLPQVFVTASTNQVVVRRGSAPFGFREETIGEHCYPAYICINPDCPGKAETGSAVIFPFRLLEKNGADCPHCLQTRDLATESEQQRQKFKVLPYYMPQCRTLTEIMLRQHYAKRAK